MTAVPWLTLGVLLPLVAAVVLRLRPPSRQLALFMAVACTVPPVGASFVASKRAGDWLVDPWHAGGVPVLGADPLSLLLLVTSSVVLGLVVVVAPRRELRAQTLASMFVRHGLAMVVFSSTHVLVLLAAWCAIVLPAMSALGSANAPLQVRRAFNVLVGGGAVLVALAGVAVATLYRDHPMDVRHIADNGLAPWLDGVLALAILAGTLSRMGLVPFHSWYPVLLADGPVTVAAPIASAFSGAYLLVRLALPLDAASSTGGPWALTCLAVVGSIYAALLALASDKLRYTNAYLVMSQSSLVLLGFGSGEADAMTGAMLFAIATGFAAVGLVITTRGLTARVGTVDLARHNGHYRAFPRLAATQFVFGLALIGFPGFASYVGEDLVFEGEGRKHLAVAIALVAVTGLNGVTFFRAFTRAFLGAAPRVPTLAPDIHPRKGLVLVGVLLVLVLVSSVPLRAIRESVHVEGVVAHER